jgi:Zn-dependent protease with chaperone function
MERGQIYEFSSRPRDLQVQVKHGLRESHASNRQCPRCDCNLEDGLLPEQEVRVGSCPSCGGLWFEAGEVERMIRSGDLRKAQEEPAAEPDPQAREAAHERMRDLAAGMLALPNLVLRSTLTLVLLYGLLALLLIALVEFGYLGLNLALVIAVAFAVVQFTLGPWFMDMSLRWLYAFDWVKPTELPEHLRQFVERVCAEQRMKFPSFGLIHDGAPAAFTYGHHPSNARVVISQGLVDMLEPAELEAVVAHELGHARNWDMALMTVANLVPFLMYYLYRVAMSFRNRDKGKEYGFAVAIGAYVLYIVSEYIVLWFSRTREYFADRFAGQATGNPNALATALVRIAYGLASQEGEAKKAAGNKEDQAQKEKRKGHIEALGALNVFDKRAAVGLVMASSTGTEAQTQRLDVEQVKGAMQWDLWNPWATYYEIHSTHPLVAKRLLYLADQAAHQGQEPLFVFDRRKPESYWDDFLVDLGMMVLPTFCFLLGVAGFFLMAYLAPNLGWPFILVCLPAGAGLAGLASLLKTRFVYRRDFFPHLSVAGLLHKVKVSAVRPVPVTLTGTIIGKGVPGLVWSEDFVLRDRTGILFLDYRQPFALWNWLFGLLRAGQYQGKEVRVQGWYRRAPVPYLEISHLDVVDGSLPSRRCYSYHARMAFGVILAVVGFGLAALLALS